MNALRVGLIGVIVLTACAGADYRIVWHTIDAGGGISAGGAYQFTGTIGQPDAGYHGGGAYELLGGFWVGGPLCIVDLADFATFAAWWLEVSCDASNNDCNGADLDGVNGVTIDDLILLASQWLNRCPYNWPL